MGSEVAHKLFRSRIRECVILSLFPLHCRRYVKHTQSPNGDSRASASASFASSSQAAECSTSSGASGSSVSEGASCCAGSSNGSNHTGACSETNGLYDGEHRSPSLSRCAP